MRANVIKKEFANWRDDFPILREKNRGQPLIYLDSSSSAQKPQAVIDTITNFYQRDYANIHRGIYELSERASQLYENTRKRVQEFIHAAYSEEIVFVRGATEAINLVAECLSQCEKWQKGDEILVSTMEHHSNIVPWYLLKDKIGIVIKEIPITDAGEIDLHAYQKLFSTRTKLVAITHASNVLGTINPLQEIIAIAHQHQVPVLVDGAQAVPHMPVNMQELDCDFYAFSGHKLYGPTGTGVLYAKKSWLERMPPYQGGGGMIETVSLNKVTFAKAPQKFEAGTPDIAGIVGLGAAIKYLQTMGMQNIYAHEQELLHYTEEKLRDISGLKILGSPAEKLGVISFVLDDVHAHDVGTILDHAGIAVRAGHHCAMPLMQRLNVPATVRVSFGLYNNISDIDALIKAILEAKRLFS